MKTALAVLLSLLLAAFPAAAGPRTDLTALSAIEGSDGGPSSEGAKENRRLNGLLYGFFLGGAAGALTLLVMDQTNACGDGGCNDLIVPISLGFSLGGALIGYLTADTTDRIAERSFREARGRLRAAQLAADVASRASIHFSEAIQIAASASPATPVAAATERSAW